MFRMLSMELVSRDFDCGVKDTGLLGCEYTRFFRGVGKGIGGMSTFA